jgi:ribosomal protein L34E
LIAFKQQSILLLSLKFRPHRATRTPHRQHRKTVIHGTRINSTAQKRGQNYTKVAKKFKSASRPWKTRACAPYLRKTGAYARLWGAKPVRLPNGAFMKLVGLPTTIGSAPKSI